MVRASDPPQTDTFLAALAGNAVAESEVLASLPDGVRITFVLQGEGGGTWTISRHNGRAEIHPIDDKRADCRLVCSLEDFRALIHGELDPRQGFVERRLKVEGDVGLVLRLQRRVR